MQDLLVEEDFRYTKFFSSIEFRDKFLNYAFQKKYTQIEKTIEL